MPSRLPTWDLADLYDGLHDPQIEADSTLLQKKARKFETTYTPLLKDEVSVAQIKQALRTYAAILSLLHKLQAYAYLEYATHVTSAPHGAFLQKISTLATDIGSHLLFFELSLSQLSDSTLTTLKDDPSLKTYHHFFEKNVLQKPHRLSLDIERVLLKKSLTSRQALIRLYQQLSTKQLYELPSSRKKQTLSDILSLARNPNRALRKAASHARHTVHDTDPLHHTFTYNTLLQDWETDMNLRNFETPEDMRHLENEISRPIVDTLVTTVVNNYPLVHHYYALKRRLLGLKKLYDYDKYAPVATTTKKYSFPQAQDIILDSFHTFSPQFADIAKTFFEKRWVDVPPHASKQSGAFCYYITPDAHPYILVNYTGTLDDVSTLAHELGHGIHAFLARDQHILNFDWPLTIAETASVFAEMITFDRLRQTLTNPRDLLALHISKIENIFATIPRQIAIFQFERRVHALRSHGELTKDQLDTIWLEEQQAMFGKSLTLTDYEKSYWQLIAHIFHTPFYVYAYAFGELLTLSLFRLYKENPHSFTPGYLEFLKSGGSQSPQDLLRPFHINLEDPSFWQKGFEEIRGLITDAEAIAKTIR